MSCPDVSTYKARTWVRTLNPCSIGVKEIGFLELKQCGIVLVKLLQDFSHDELPHEFGFIPDLILLTIEDYGLLLTLIK